MCSLLLLSLPQSQCSIMFFNHYHETILLCPQLHFPKLFMGVRNQSRLAVNTLLCTQPLLSLSNIIPHHQVQEKHEEGPGLLWGSGGGVQRRGLTDSFVSFFPAPLWGKVGRKLNCCGMLEDQALSKY